MSGVLGLWVTHKDQTTTFKFHLRKREKQDYNSQTVNDRPWDLYGKHLDCDSSQLPRSAAGSTFLIHPPSIALDEANKT
jgi:hypothetical protein